MKTTRSRLSLVVPALCCAAWGYAAPNAVAQAYPSKNVQIILPYTAGGSTDVIARAVAKRLGDMWGKSVVVDNRPGASGMIGAEIASKAEPDGYTLLSTTSSYPATAAVRKKLPFDPATAIVPIATFARAPMLLTPRMRTRFALIIGSSAEELEITISTSPEPSAMTAGAIPL